MCNVDLKHWELQSTEKNDSRIFCLAATSSKAAISTRLRHRGTSIMVRSAGDWVLTAERWLSEVVSKVTPESSGTIAVSRSHDQGFFCSSDHCWEVKYYKVQCHTLVLWTKLDTFLANKHLAGWRKSLIRILCIEQHVCIRMNIFKPALKLETHNS